MVSLLMPWYDCTRVGSKSVRSIDDAADETRLSVIGEHVDSEIVKVY